MIRALHVLVMTAALAPQLEPLHSALDPVCRDAQAACATEPERDASCQACDCCVSGLPTIAANAPSDLVPQRPTIPAALAPAADVPPSPPPTKIPHVPKTSSR